MAIRVGAGFFILALFLSALFDPRIRLLHVLQALIYITIIILTARNSSFGFGAGCAIALLWNYTNLFVTSFIAEGLRFLWLFVQTGRLKHPDLLVAVIASAGHFLMIGACITGFILLRPRTKEWVQFLSGGIISVLYFALIIVTTGPQYVGLLRRVFHL